MPISADTFSVEVARAALAAGAVAVNDISGGSEEMFELVAETRLRLRADAHRGAAAGRPAGARLRRRGRAPEVVVRGESRARPASLGVGEEQIAIDPGLDFDLNTEQDLEILRRLPELRALGLPLYVSLSRKDFIGAVLAGSWEERLPAGEREWGTVAAVALAVRGGADVLRIHDRSSLQAMRVAGHAIEPAASAERRLMAKSLLEAPWSIALDPARRDGRIVAESGEEEREAQDGGAAALARPRLRRGAEARRRRAPLLAPARRRWRRPPPRTW